MNRNHEIDLFLKRLSSMYIQNPTIPISKDTIYSELRVFKYNEQFYERINSVDISNVQFNLEEKYGKDNRFKTFSNGYFWVIENHGNIDDFEDYKNTIYNSVKMYISVDEDNIEYVASNIFNFMIQNNIVNQSKISKNTRSDALVLRVATIEDAKKISDFVNNQLKYNSRNKTNPFLYTEGKVSFAMDGKVSFNQTISEIIEYYLNIRKNDNTLDLVNFNDFIYFLNYEYREMIGLTEEAFNQLFNRIQFGFDVNKSDYKLMAYVNLCNNLNGQINSLDYFKSLQNVNFLNKYNKSMGNSEIMSNKLDNNQIEGTYSNISNEQIYNNILSLLMNLKSRNEINSIFTNYVTTGNLAFFTRQDGIRKLVSENFNVQSFFDTMNIVGWKNLINAFKKTYEKYGYNHIIVAIEKLMYEDSFSSFTNDGGVRIMLTNSIPLPYLKELIYKKVIENGKSYSIDNIIECLFNEMNKINEKEVSIGYK